MYIPDGQGSFSLSMISLPTDEPLRAIAQPIARLLSLPHLVDHFPLLVYAFCLFTAVHLVISPVLSARFFPASYGKLRSRRAINQWCAATTPNLSLSCG